MPNPILANWPARVPPWKYTGAPTVSGSGVTDILQADSALPCAPNAKLRPIIAARGAMLATATVTEAGGIDQSYRGGDMVSIPDDYYFLELANVLWEPPAYYGKAGTPVQVPRLVILRGLCQFTGAPGAVEPRANWGFHWDASTGSSPDIATADKGLAITALDAIYSTHFAPKFLSVLATPILFFSSFGPHRSLVDGVPPTQIAALTGDDSDYVLDPSTFLGGDLLVITFANSAYDLGYCRNLTQLPDPVTGVYGPPPADAWQTANPGGDVTTGGQFGTSIDPNHRRDVLEVYTDALARDQGHFPGVSDRFRNFRHVLAYDVYDDPSVLKNILYPLFPVSLGSDDSTAVSASPGMAQATFAALVAGGLAGFATATFDSRTLSSIVSLVQSEIVAMWP